MKSEPDVFSIDDLKQKGSSLWDGVRNYQARNFMLHDMKVGDQVLIYHSNAEPSGIAGLAEVTLPAKPDPTQFDKSSPYFERRATKEKPVWFGVTVKYKKTFKNFISLADLRTHKELQEMLVLKKGQRLSIQPVAQRDFEFVIRLGLGARK